MTQRDRDSRVMIVDVVTWVVCRADPKTRQITQRRYRSQMADQICYAVLCVFSYIAAGLEQQKKKQHTRQIAAKSEEEVLDPRPLTQHAKR